MTAQSIGDLAQAFLLRRQSVEAKQSLGDQARALTTGRVADPGARLKGDYGALTVLERRITISESYRLAGAEAATLARGQQAALGAVAEATRELAIGLIEHASGTPAQNPLRGTEAEAAFASVVSSLNTSAGGRSLFAGVASDGPALAPAQAMLADIRAAVAGLTEPGDVVAAVEAWFEDPAGGFATTGYLGGDTPLSPILVDEGEQLQLSTRADDPALKALLAALALGTIAGDPNVTLSDPARAAVFRSAGDRMLAAQDGIIALRAGVGQVEARIEKAATRLSAESAAAEVARAELVGVDRFEAATRLKDAERRLELVYEVTARLSRFSLLDRL